MDRPRSQRITLREGRRGARERYLYTRPWGLDLARIAIPVDLWHGLLDATIPVRLREISLLPSPAAQPHPRR